MNGDLRLRMPKPGLHPMRHLVRHVFPNGASIITQMAWQRPYAGLEIVTRFHDVDYLNGKPSDHESGHKAVGQRAKFENKFKPTQAEN